MACKRRPVLSNPAGIDPSTLRSSRTDRAVGMRSEAHNSKGVGNSIAP